MPKHKLTPKLNLIKTIPNHKLSSNLSKTNPRTAGPPKKWGRACFGASFSVTSLSGWWMERRPYGAEQRKGNITFAFLVVCLSATSLMIAVYIFYIQTKLKLLIVSANTRSAFANLMTQLTHVRWSHKIQHLTLNFCCLSRLDIKTCAYVYITSQSMRLKMWVQSRYESL